MRAPDRRGRGSLFQRPARAVRRDLSQLVCAVLGLLLGLVTPMMSAGPRVDAGRAANLLFTIGFGVISLVSIIYSMLFLVVQFSAGAFTPRLALFRDEPIVWRAFAFTVGVFVFCVTSGLSIGVSDSVSALVPCLAMLSSLIAIGLMRTLQMKAFGSIQLGHSLTAICDRAHLLFDDLYERPYDPGREARPPPVHGAGGTPVRWSGPAAVVRRIDVRALVALAEEHDCAIAFRVTPGTPVWRGTVLAEVSGAGGPPASALLAAVATGSERTFDQDPDLPFRLLADIALRALSPAVNDPATAVESMDRTEDLLTRLADRELDIGRFPDGAGRLRVTVPVPDWEQYVATAVDELSFAAAGSPMALRRLRDLLARLEARCPAERRAVVRERLRRVDRTGAGAHPLVWAAPTAP
ncbi:DUF2254 family protein [Streptomyces sp. NPDC057939]|uniref:DUF2254 family protein n=1 Tax=Streptomyces sp. NPDC057939 TaxID=3346284 RepID=UPI0036E2D411